MERRIIVGIMVTLLMVGIFHAILDVKLVTAWSNGGYGGGYGTHDWIAQHALDWLPGNEKEYIQANLAAYLYGTEMPDRSPPEGYGDSVLHHIYYWSEGSLQDDASAIRAQEQYEWAVTYVNEYGNISGSVLMLGTMSHYIVDVGVFGHVMGSETDWGPEVHHSDYETYVNERTNSYEDEFCEYLWFDEELRIISAYDAALELAYDTTFGHGEGYLGCVWMDENYNWNNTAFKDRCGESLNLCVNLLADVLHTFYEQVMSGSTRYSWPMFHHDLKHTGYTESPMPANQELWSYTTEGRVVSSPAVVDGKVYVGSEDDKVYCLDASTGAFIWSYTTDYLVYSSPAVADGKVYVGSEDRNIYCLDASTGAYIWSYGTGDYVFSSPAVVDGKVYVGSLDGRVYCLDAFTGAYIWSYTTGSFVFSSSAVVGGRVYVGSYDYKIYCLDAFTGAYIWSYTTDYPVYSSPAVVDGKVYVGSDDNRVYCLDAFTGAYIWSYTTGNDVRSCPAVVGDRVYVGSLDDKVYCLDASTGAFIWSYTTGNDVSLSSAAVVGDRVYVGSEDYKIYCLDAFTGAYIWSYTTGSIVYSSPAIADGVVFVGSDDHNVYAFGNVIRYPEDGHPTIQAAINAAPPGATISIAVGTYHESIVLNKPLTILGRKGSAPIFDGGGSGIAVTITSSGSGSTVAGIIITNWDQGMLVSDASNCKIYDNIMSLIGTCGIGIEGTNAINNQIYSNIFQDNTVAIDLLASSTTNTIYKNIITTNTVGLSLKSSGNIIYANTISENDLGIDVTNSANNIIYHNNFANKIENAISGGTYNAWDNGYPSGGNYWSDYTGLDEKSGPGQNVLGSDGIGDTQYTVAANNIDNYPLVQPFNRHDIGIVNVITSKTAIGQGFTLFIDVKILNYGLYDETFTMTIRANTLVIAMQTITLTKRNSVPITFPWNTIGVAKGTYTITVVVDTVPDETDVADNTYPDGSVTITWLGDLNKDFVVDEDDLWIFCGAFIDYYKIHVRNINCDFDDNFKIDEDDLWIMAQAFIDYWKHH